MWKEENNKLKKEFKFDDFRSAFAFMTRVAFIAEEHQHHPDWSNSYNTLIIELTSHDQGEVVTQKDKKMADAIDKI